LSDVCHHAQHRWIRAKHPPFLSCLLGTMPRLCALQCVKSQNRRCSNTPVRKQSPWRSDESNSAATGQRKIRIASSSASPRFGLWWSWSGALWVEVQAARCVTLIYSGNHSSGAGCWRLRPTVTRALCRSRTVCSRSRRVWGGCVRWCPNSAVKWAGLSAGSSHRRRSEAKS